MSKTSNSVSAAAAVIGDQQYGIRISDQGAFFIAEARALLLVLKNIEKGQEWNFLIASDSKLCLQAFESIKTDHHIIIEILTNLDLLKSLILFFAGFQVTLD